LAEVDRVIEGLARSHRSLASLASTALRFLDWRDKDQDWDDEDARGVAV
jgi:hypothetical protein